MFFVVFSYASKAALKMGRKLEDEEEAMGAALDIGLVGKTRTNASSATYVLMCSQSDDGVIPLSLLTGFITQRSPSDSVC